MPNGSEDIIRRLRRLENPGLRTFADEKSLVLERAKGAWLEDIEGQRYLDLSGLYAVAIVGHGHPKVVAAIQKQAADLMHCPSAMPSRVRAEFLEAIESIVPKELDCIMPAMTGAMANEIAVSMARARRPRGRVVSFSGSYFGRSPGVVGLAGKSQYRDALNIDSDAAFLPFPNTLTMGPDASKQVIDTLRLLSGPAGGLGEIAAVIIEPVQGNGGVIVPPADFLPGLRRFCDESGALLISDEIQCGNGRSGKMWAAERFGVIPDILTMGKGIGGGMAVAAVASRRDLANWRSDSYSSTFLTNNVNLAAAIASIEVMRSEKLSERAAMLGPKYFDILKQRLSGLPGVAQVRGFGFWYAIELANANGEPDGKSASALLRKIREKGVVAGGGGYSGQCIKMAPPLTISEDDFEHGLNVVVEAVTTWSAQRSTN